MRVPLFAIRAQNLSLRQGLEQGILSVLQQGLFIDGPHVASFEQAFAEACGCKYCVGVGNGTDGLYLALKALGIGSGDEVITTAYSFVATAQAITRTGAEVRFVDIERATCNLDTALIEPLITPRTRAILPVHLFGRPADMAALHHLARHYGLHLVEDAAQAHGAMDHGKPVGSLGNLACFSFYPTKNLGAIGDGGAVVTDNASLGERVRHLSRQARLPDSDYGRDGINSRLDAVQAAVLSVKLTHLAEWTERRQQIADRYRQQLDGSPLILPPTDKHARPAYHVYPIRVRDGRRDALQQHLLANGIESRVYYSKPLPRLKGFAPYVLSGQRFPEANRASREILGLPMSPEMPDTTIDYVANCIAGFLAAKGQRYGIA
jgi:dTDP-4-amino-4,6-dideoxygalactose transaminase